jgi:Icc-related predicted phosphoesterase
LTRILVVADEVDESLYGDRLPLLRPEIVLSCGDLPFEYLEHLVNRLEVPLYYVPGNHDPNLKAADPRWSPLSADSPATGPAGCQNIDARIVESNQLLIAGLGGSIRYRRGPNQYSQGEMRRRALALEVRIRLKRRPGRRLDIFVTHAPPFGVAAAEDAAHTGFVAFVRLIQDVQPALAVHGHIHPYGRSQPDRSIGATRVVNAVPSKLIEV